MKTANRLLLGLQMLAFAGGVLAEQTIQFQVPVKLNKLYSDVKSFSVGCKATTSQNPGVSHAFGRADINILGKGGYDGLVTVPVKVPDSVSTQVDYWVCELHLFHVSAASGCKPDFNAPLNACKAKQGSQLVTKVQGALLSGRSIKPLLQKLK